MAREQLIQLALESKETIHDYSMMSNNEISNIIREVSFANVVVYYLCKEVMMNGTEVQKEQVQLIMQLIHCIWDEPNKVFKSLVVDTVYLSTDGFVWCEELSTIVDNALEMLEYEMTDRLRRMVRLLLTDLSSIILYYGTDIQIHRMNAFL